MSAKPFRHFDFTFEQPHLDLKFRVSSVKCKCMSCEDLRLEAWDEGKMVLSKDWYLHPMEQSNLEANIIQAMAEHIQELEDKIQELTSKEGGLSPAATVPLTEEEIAKMQAEGLEIRREVQKMTDPMKKGPFP